MKATIVKKYLTFSINAQKTFNGYEMSNYCGITQ
jgi:hypothetical protein